jgi:NhaP-type Na+/H+ or K+/H+ antiporter
METRATGRSKRQTSYEFYKKLYKLTIGGGVAFWATTIAFSLLPIAAEFRAALSISYVQVVLVESLLGGMIIGCCVSYSLLRFFDKIPTKNPILKSEILSIVALGIALVLLQVAASRTSDALHVFLNGAMLNVPRFLFLGIVIGYLYKRLYGSA